MLARSAISIILLCLTLIWRPAAAASDTSPLEFNYGIPTADHPTVFIARDLGLFEKVGLKPHFYFFQSGAPLLAGLKSGSLDVVTAGLALPFALGQGIPLKFLFWEVNDADAEGLVVGPKSGIKSYRDIGKAKAIAAASGTCAQVALYLMAQKMGIDYAKLNVINIPAPLFRNAFLSKSIDAGIAWPPYSLQLQSEGFPVVSFDADYTPKGGACPGLTAVRPAFLQQHPDIALKLIRVEALAREELAKNPKIGAEAVAKQLSVPLDVATAMMARQCCDEPPSFAEQVDPNSPYSMTSKEGGLIGKLMLASEALHAVGAIPQPLSLSALQEAVDPSYLQQYLKSSPK